MTVIRLLDSTKVYLHAVIDSFSRRILAWRVTENFSVGRRWRSYRRWIGVRRDVLWSGSGDPGPARVREEESPSREAGGQQGGCMWDMPIAIPIDPVVLRDGIEIIPWVVQTGLRNGHWRVQASRRAIRPTLHWDRTARGLLASVARRICAGLRRSCMSSTRTRKSRMFVEIARVHLKTRGGRYVIAEGGGGKRR